MTITMGAAFEKRYESLLKGGRKELARVWPFPGSVVLTISLEDDELTADQAEQLGQYLIKAADDARHLHHFGDEAMLRDDRISDDH